MEQDRGYGGPGQYHRSSLSAGRRCNFIRSKDRGETIAGDGVPGEGDMTDQDFVLVCDNCLSDTRQTTHTSTIFPTAYP